MYPAVLPETVRTDPGRRAECFVYDQLSTLADDYHVFYSVKWQGPSRQGYQRDGEADFVIASADRGLLVMEVKGGRVEYQGLGQGWVSLSPQGRRRRASRDPFDQAKDSLYALMARLNSEPGWANRPLTRGHAVGLPDVAVPAEISLPPQCAQATIVDSPSFERLAEAVEGCFTHWAGTDPGGPLGDDRLKLVIDLLDGWVVLPEQWSHAAIEQRIVELTDQQLFVLDLLRYHRRALIGGCAGSGKTLLAAEQARRLAAAGHEVLLTCFNRPLGRHLAAGAGPGVTATNFHNFCFDLAAAAGIAHARKQAKLEYFDHELPQAMVKAARTLGRSFDALVIDEAQDFKDVHWHALAEILTDPDQAPVFCFYDSHQDLYTIEDGGLPPVFRRLTEQPPHDLSRNCRNTQSIHRVAIAFCRRLGPDCAGPVGPPVTLIETSRASDQADAVAGILAEWVESGLEPEEIVLLTGHTPRPPSPFAEGEVIAGLTLSLDSELSRGELLVSTVQRFKGMERRAVILADLDDEVHPDLPSVLYVGCSRARERLAIVIDQTINPKVLAKLRETVGTGAVGDAAS